MDVLATIAKIRRTLAEWADHFAGGLDTPYPHMYAAINYLFNRAFGRRKSILQFGVKPLSEIPHDPTKPNFFLEKEFVDAVEENTARFERACRSGSIEIPDDEFPVNRKIRTFGVNVNIKGLGEESAIVFFPNKANPDGTPDTTWGEVLDFNISDGLKHCKLESFSIILHDDFLFGSAITGTAYATSLPSSGDFVLTRQNFYIKDIFIYGSNAFTTDRPWSHGTQYGVKLYNPNYSKVDWLFIQGNGIETPEPDVVPRNNTGLYIESSRGGYECTYTNLKFAGVRYAVVVKNPIYVPGNFPLGQEGSKFDKCVFVDVYDAFRLIGDTGGSPGWHILFSHMAIRRHALYVEQFRQGWFLGNLVYHSGHNDPGISAFVYLNKSASDWEIASNKFYWIGSPDTLKDPYGVLIAGGYIEVLDRFELAVANSIHHNTFVGAGRGKTVFWPQNGAINNDFHSNRSELFAQPLRNLPQNKFYNNTPSERDRLVCILTVRGEQVVNTVPVVDEYNDPVSPPAFRDVIEPRLSEGGELALFMGNISAVRKTKGGDIDTFPVGSAADPNGYIIDLQWTWAKKIVIRSNYISAINITDPDHPVEVITPFTGKNIRGFAVRYDQEWSLETEIPIQLTYNADLLPLKAEQNITLLPGERIEFANTDEGIREMDYFSTVHLTDTLDSLPESVDFMLDNSAAATPVWSDPTGYKLWTVYKRRYKSPAGNIFEDQWLVNAKNGTVLHRVKHDTGVTPWTQLSGPSVFTMTTDGILSDVPYLLQATIEGKSLWHLRQTEYITVDNVQHLNQVAYDDDGTMCILRSKIGSGAWTKWQKIGARLIDGMSQITNRDFGVYIDEYDNLQVGAKSTSGAEYKLLRDPPTVSQSLVTGSDFLLMYDNASKRWYKITEDDQITIIRRVTDSIYLRRDNIPTVASFTTKHKQIRYDITTGQLVRLA